MASDSSSEVSSGNEYSDGRGTASWPLSLMHEGHSSPQPAAGGDRAALDTLLNSHAAGAACSIYAEALHLLQQHSTFESLNCEFHSVMEHDEGFDAAAGRAPHNRLKNRYADVVPYDANRVRLPPLPPTAGASALPAQLHLDGAAADDYVNASLVWDPQGWGHVCGYVAAQAPLAPTLPDFWRMLLVTNASAVVMLARMDDAPPTNRPSACAPPNRPRCAPYFPTLLHETLDVPGVARVTCVHVSTLDGGTPFRQLQVSPWDGADEPCGGGGGIGGAAWQGGGGGEVRYINHYHLDAWPDHGVPASSAPVRRLCRVLDGCRRAGCSIAVHCSAGVGRTGTFIAIDLLLQRLDALRLQLGSGPAAAAPRAAAGMLNGAARGINGGAGNAADGVAGDATARIAAAFDVPRLVCGLRRQRVGMVQTGEQYGFVYRAAIDALHELLQEAAAVEAAA